MKFAGVKLKDERHTKKKTSLGNLAAALTRLKVVKFNKDVIKSETEKVELTRKKILNDDELQVFIQEKYESYPSNFEPTKLDENT